MKQHNNQDGDSVLGQQVPASLSAFKLQSSVCLADLSYSNCLSDLREVSGRHLSSSGKRKLIAISQKHEPEPRTVEKWSTHCKRAGAFYIISSCLFFYWLKFHTLLFLFIHEASHWYLFEIHIFYQLLLIAYTLVDSWLFSSTHARP